MDILFAIVIAVHALAAVFWAGSTFVQARNGGRGAKNLFGPQMGAATITILAGAYLWWAVFGAGSGSMWLGIGAVCAIAAAGVQGVMIGRNRSKLPGDKAAMASAALGHRIAAVLLAIALITMVVK